MPRRYKWGNYNFPDFFIIQCFLPAHSLVCSVVAVALVAGVENSANYQACKKMRLRKTGNCTPVGVGQCYGVRSFM